MNTKEEVILLPHKDYCKLISCYPYVFFKDRRTDNYMPAVFSSTAVHMFSITLCDVISLYCVLYVLYFLLSCFAEVENWKLPNLRK